MKSNTLQSLTGNWNMRDWRHGKEKIDKKRTETNKASLTQDGVNVKGSFSNNDGDYELEGKIENNLIITGTWRLKNIGVGGIWHGAFQFKILDNADRMLGKWVGVTKNLDSVNYGVWEWKKHGVDKYPTEVDKYPTEQEKKRLTKIFKNQLLRKIATGVLIVLLGAWAIYYFGPKQS